MRPYQAVLITITGLFIAAIAAFLLYGGKTGGRGVASVGGPFTLTDHEGRARTDKDFRGRFTLVYFGYTYCPDVCPTALQVITNAMEQLDENLQSKITPIFITVDPERDTVNHLKSYVENFHPRLVGLTGSTEQIAHAARIYRVYYSKSKNSIENLNDYLMDHSSIVFLMSPHGDYVTHFTHSTPMKKMVDVLRRNVEANK